MGGRRRWRREDNRAKTNVDIEATTPLLLYIKARPAPTTAARSGDILDAELAPDKLDGVIDRGAGDDVQARFVDYDHGIWGATELAV